MSSAQKQQFFKLVNKLLDGSISKEELDKLIYFFLNNQDIENWPEDLGSKDIVKDKIYEKIRLELDLTDEKPTKVIPLYKKPIFKYAVAATVALFLTFSIVFLNQYSNNSNETEVVTNNIQVGTDKATLTLEDGSEVVLMRGKTVQSKNFNSTGDKLLYNDLDAASQEIAYNYLTIPRGGQYSIQLADGTMVWLNSETKLKYPVHFIDGKTRKVELIYGEAYFDVSPSTEHAGAGFSVIQNNQEIHVLGTEFNLKAYKDESQVYTTLVEGKVEIQFGDKTEMLEPNQRASLDISANNIEIKNVDVYNDISWKDGVFSFEDKPLEEIMNVLSRWYDMEVIFENESIKQEEFIGVLFKDRSIEEILTSIKNSGIINKYEFDDKILILK